jgi:hypothetical protein
MKHTKQALVKSTQTIGILLPVTVFLLVGGVLAGVILVPTHNTALAQSGGDFDLSWSTIDGGGETGSVGGDFAVYGTLGQPDAGSLSGGVFEVEGGFWNRGVGPTGVVVGSFHATVSSKGVILTWQTVSEHNNLGFNLYRSESPELLGERLNETLIPSQAPGEGMGASYAFLDGTILPGVTCYYTLEDVDVAGRSTGHGPVTVTPWWSYLPLVPSP